jgi:hypothetical protein
MLNQKKTLSQVPAKAFAIIKEHFTMLFMMIVLGCAIMGTTYLYFKTQTLAAQTADSITPLDHLPDISHHMTLAKGCPVPISDLVYVKLRFWGFDNEAHVGCLIVNKELGQDVLTIFKELFKYKYPIEQMRPLYEFDNNDERSMAENNTSAFNCREVTGQPGLYSQHSYGRAIDINPQINPYVKNSTVLPESGRSYLDPNNTHKAKITRQSLPYQLFSRHGWDWGGSWHDLQDLQHFEKRPHVEKRNPNGYSKEP